MFLEQASLCTVCGVYNNSSYGLYDTYLCSYSISTVQMFCVAVIALARVLDGFVVDKATLE
jgi:hypothetical protein